MSCDPILLVGGSGVVGQQTAQHLRKAHPAVPLLIGGRDLNRAEAIAKKIGNAEAVVVDLDAADLNLGSRAVSAVAVFFKDDKIAALHFAQARGVPYISISSGVQEIGPEVAAFMHRPPAAPIVLGAEWFIGAATVPAIDTAKDFKQVDSVTVRAVVEEGDIGGPATYKDMERLIQAMPAVLTVKDGNYLWLKAEDTPTSLQAIDGTEMTAEIYSPYDVLSLANETGAANVEFRLAIGESSSSRRGEPLSTEIIIDMYGKDHANQPLHKRRAVVHPEGQIALSGMGVALVLERLLGLSGSPVHAGLYFPSQLLDPQVYLTRLHEAGGESFMIEVDAD